MRLLALDSSGPLLSLACVEDGQVTAMWEGELPGRRSEQMLPKALSLFEKLEWDPESLSAVAVSRGPGSFTGLRVGLAFAKGLALDGVRVLSESTLEVWAQALAPGLIEHGSTRLAVLLDARRGQVYRGVFEMGAEGWTSPLEPRLVDLSAAREGIEDAALGGDLPEAPWQAPWIVRQRPLAQGLAELVLARLKKDPDAAEPAALIKPDYLRRPEVEILWEKRRA